jgi:hypothetical protein
MDTLMMLSPVATVLCGVCRRWSWACGDPLLDHCRGCGHALPAVPLYARIWDDTRPQG